MAGDVPTQSTLPATWVQFHQTSSIIFHPIQPFLMNRMVNFYCYVVNYHLPDVPETYVHRSGRTARAGKSGFSIALILPNEINRIQEIQKELGIKFLEITV